MKRVIICLICLLAAAMLPLGICEGAPDRSGQALSVGTLIGVRCTNSGNEFGNTYSAEIDYTEEGTLTLTVSESECFDQPTAVNRYAAADDTLGRIAEIVEANHMTAWAERPDYLSVCDAAHPYLILEVLDENCECVSYSISGYIEFTEAEQAAYDAVWDIVLESRKSGNLLESYTYGE